MDVIDGTDLGLGIRRGVVDPHVNLLSFHVETFMHFLSLFDLSESKSGFDANYTSVDSSPSAALIGGGKIFDVVLPIFFRNGMDVFAVFSARPMHGRSSWPP